MRMGFWSSMVAAGVMLSPALAAAEEVKQIPECTREPTDADVAAAKAAFQAGNASFNEADYPRAILYWEDAYRRDCTAHALLLNLARAYELSNQKRQAVVALQAFLARQPDSAQKDQILRRIEVLNKQIEQDQRAATPAPVTPAITQPQTPATPASTTTLQAQTATPMDSGTTSRSPLPLFVAGGGAVVAIVGGIVYFISANKVDGYENDPPPDGCGGDRQTCPDEAVENGVLDRANAAVTRQDVGGVVALVGLGAVAGGLIWYFVQEPRQSASHGRQRRTKKLALDPQVGRGFAGLSLGGSF